MMQWGMMPSFSAPASKYDPYKMMNARCETLTSSPVFRRLINTHRCLVLLEGFYEWKTELGGKQPYFIGPSACKADPVLYAAGLYDVWTDATGRIIIHVCRGAVRRLGFIPCLAIVDPPPWFASFCVICVCTL